MNMQEEHPTDRCQTTTQAIAAKEVLANVIDQYERKANRLKVLRDLLPTKLTSEQNDALIEVFFELK